MAITLRSSSTRQTGTIPSASAAIVAQLPAGWVAGDIVFIYAACLKNGIGSTITGWNMLFDYNSNQDAYALFWRRMVAGDTAPSVTFAGSFGSNQYFLQTHCWTNLNKADSPIATPVFNNGNATVTVPSVTSDYDDQVELVFAQGNRGSGSWTLPAGVTVVDSANLLDGNGFYVAYSHGYIAIPTAGTTVSPGNATNNSGFGQASRSYVVRMYGEPTTADRLSKGATLFDPQDSVAGVGDNPIAGSGSLTDPKDTISGDGIGVGIITLASNEGPDSFSGSVVASPQITLTTTESPDAFSGDYLNTSPAAIPTYTFAQGNLVTANANASSTTTKSVTPATLGGQDGDIQILITTVIGSTAIPTLTNSEFIQLGSDVSVGSGVTMITLRMYYRPWTASASGTVNIVLPAGANNSALSATTFGVRGATIDSLIESFGTATYAGYTSTTIPGLANQSVRQNSLLVQGYVHNVKSTGTPPSGWTERLDYPSTIPSGASGQSIQVNTSTVTAPTTTTAGNETFSNATSKNIIAFEFALSGSVIPADRYAYVSANEDTDTYQGALQQDLSGVNSPFTLSAVESSQDSFSGAVSTGQSISLSATESKDTYSGSTSINSNANLTANENTDTYSGSAQSITTVALVSNEPTDTFSGSATINSNANLTATEAKDTFAGSATSVTTVALSGQEATDSYSGAVSATTSVTFAPTESADTIQVVLSTRIEMVVAANETPDSYAGSAAVVAYVQFGNSTEGPDNYAGSVAATTPFSVAATDGPDSYSGSAAITGTTTLAATESPADSFSGSANAFTSMQIGATEPRDTIQSSLAITSTMQVAATEAADTTSMVYDTRTVATLAAVEGADTYAGPMGITANLYFVSTEARDSFAGTYSINSNVQVSATDSADTFNGLIDNRTLMTVNATEANDTYAGPMAITGSYTISATEGPDAFFMPITATTQVLLGATEQRDSYAGMVSATTNFVLAGFEANDNYSGSLQAVTTASLAATEAKDGYAGTQAVVAAVQVSSTENTGDSFAGSITSSVDYRLSATEDMGDSLSVSIEVRGSLNLGATETASDSLAGTVAVTGSFQLGAVETGSDRFRGHLYNRVSQNDMYVNTENGWTAVNPVLVNVANVWIEPKAGYVRVANGTWVRIYGKL